MEKNVGTYDALMRITGGLFGLALGTSRMVRSPHKGMPIFITMMSGMKVAEGILQWCPLYELLGLSSIERDHRIKSKIKPEPMINSKE